MELYGIEEMAVNRSWATLNDIDPETINQWNKMSGRFIDPLTLKMPARLSKLHAEQNAAESGDLIAAVRRESDAAAANLSKPHLFLLTDTTGIVVGLEGTKSVIETLEAINLGIGTSFAIEHVGINAICAAMHLNRTTAVFGEEHYLRLFKQWTCICTPIQCGCETAGFLCLSFQKECDLSSAVILLEKIACDVGNRV